jgi:hypothetical protein
MQTNEYLKDQKQIIQDLLIATLLELERYPELTGGDLIVGANENVLTLRNCGKGIPAGTIARAVLPETDGAPLDRPVSELYPIEALMEADSFELHSFHSRECTSLRYEKGARQELRVYPDIAQDGLLIHLEWNGALPQDRILSGKDVATAMRRLYSEDLSLARPVWKPTVWFNGNRIRY